MLCFLSPRSAGEATQGESNDGLPQSRLVWTAGMVNFVLSRYLIPKPIPGLAQPRHWSPHEDAKIAEGAPM